MDENKNQSGAQHLTSIDIDITPLQESLKNASQEIQKYSVESGKALNSELQSAVNKASKVEFVAPKMLDGDEIERAKRELEELVAVYGKVAKVTAQYDPDGNGIVGSVTFDDEQGRTILANFERVEEEWKQLSQTVTDNIQKRENLERKEAEKTKAIRLQQEKEIWEQREKDEAEQLRMIEEERLAWEQYEKAKQKEDSEISKGTEKELAEYERELEQQKKLAAKQSEESFKQYEQVQNQKIQKIEEERLAWENYNRQREADEKELAKLSKQETEAYIGEEEKKERYKKDSISKLETMIEQQTRFNALVKRQKFSFAKSGIISEGDELIQRMNILIERFKMSGEVTKEMESEFRRLQSEMKGLGVAFKESGAEGDSFLKKISDKAKWLSAFYIVNELRQGLVKTVDTIRDTEDAVVDLQRVLNQDYISRSTMSEELQNIAFDYARDFSDVSEVSTAFAQAGYDWNDTLKLTEGTMLALNTAELDVTQSTQGLIAIMKQWGFQAEDYASVIDKINITADNFAVTSGNIVAALQRSSSSAKNANISFERTIGLITALAEATGRSGENIGTALNSLIIYTSSNKSLEAFAENGSQAMKDLVKEYRSGAASIYDVWSQLSLEVKHLSASQQAALFDNEAYKEFAEEISSQSSEFTDQVNQIYGQAGKYRQNYFIALLDDIKRAEEAVDGMADSEGYSLRENQKYMETLTAQWTQLKDMLAQLAVQFGEAGFLDILKGIVKFGTGLAKVTKEAGGLSNVLREFVGVLLIIKRQNMVNLASAVRNDIATLTGTFKSLKAEVIAANGVMAKAKVVTSNLGTAFSTLAAGVGTAMVAFSIFSQIVTTIKSKEEEERKARIEANNEIISQSKSIIDLTAKYNALAAVSTDTAAKETALRDVNSEITKALGDRADVLKGLTVGTQEYTDKLEELNKAELEQSRFAAQKNRELAGKEFAKEGSIQGVFRSDKFSIAKFRTDNNNVQKILDKTIGSFKKFDLATSTYYYAPLKNTPEGLADWMGALKSAQSELDKLGAQSEETGEIILNDSAYKNLTRIINEMNESFTDFFSYRVKEEAYSERIKFGVIETKEEYENFKNAVFAATGANEVFKDATFEIIDSLFPSLKDSLDEVGQEFIKDSGIGVEAVDGLEEKLKELNKIVDDFQSGYSAVSTAMQEFNETGYLSVDTVQSLLSVDNELISALEFTADGATINASKARELFNAQQKNIEAMISETTHAGLLEIAQRYLGESTDELGAKSTDAEPKVNDLDSALKTLADDAVSVAFSTSAAGDAIDGAFKGKTTWNNLHNMKREMLDYLETMNGIYRSVRDNARNESAWYDKSARKEQDAAIKERKKALEAEKKAIKSKYKAEIDALKALKKEKDQQRKEDEYWRKRQEALKDVSKAETRSGVEYREKEEEAREKLAELDRKHQEDAEKQAIDDKIKQLEELRDSEIAAIDAQIKTLEDGVVKVQVSAITALSDSNKQNLKNYEVEYLEPFTQETKQTYTDVYAELPAVFGESLNLMLDMTKLNSAQMFNIYNENFFSKMKQSMAETRALMMPFTVARPDLSQYYVNPEQRAMHNITNNNTRSANVFANVYNESSANGVMNSIFNMP